MLKEDNCANRKEKEGSEECSELQDRIMSTLQDTCMYVSNQIIVNRLEVDKNKSKTLTTCGKSNIGPTINL